MDMPAAERDGEIDRLCGSERGHADALKAKVRRMLDAHDGDAQDGGAHDDDGEFSSFMAKPAAALVDPSDLEGAPLPECIDRFRVLALLGEGGFGSVYRVSQMEPIARDVALKVIKPGMDSTSVIARFTSERQTLASLQHEHIATIFDAGKTADGRPYFVMELIEGLPITKHCDERQLPIEARLSLFLDVCGAVEYAHRKGIIHRDLKPSNVLVHIEGDRAVAKVIDFGIARAIDATGDARMTMPMQLVGTPDYMSPEQVEAAPEGVDTRVDVYALGVLLYELLVGVTPLDIASRTGSSLASTLQAIRTEEPLRPSARLDGLGPRRAEIAAARATDPKRHRAALVGDLDWIVMRAIDKDVTRRYGSVEALAADIRRHRAHEPVSAAAPSAWYQTRKFMRRHRVGVTASVVVLLALTAGLAATLVSFARTREAESISRSAKDEAAAVNAFLIDDLFGAASPERDGVKVTVVDALANAVATVDARFKDQPVLAAKVRMVVARLYCGLGLYGEAHQAIEPCPSVFREALGPADVATLEAQNILAEALSFRGDLSGAEEILRSAFAAASASTADIGPDIGPWPYTIEASLGEVLQKLGRHAEAQQHLRHAIDGLDRMHPVGNLLTLDATLSLAASLGAERRYEEALPYATAALQHARAQPKKDHPALLAALTHVAALAMNLGRPAEAEPYYRELLAMTERANPEGHWQIALSQHLVGACIVRQERWEEAQPLLLQGADGLWASLGPDHPFTEQAYLQLCTALQKNGDPAYLSTLKRAIGIRLRVSFPNEAERVVIATKTYVAASKEVRQEVEGDAAIPDLAIQELEDIGTDMLARNEHRAGRYLSNIGWAALEIGDTARAERVLRKAESHLADPAQRTDEPSDHQAVVERLATLYERSGRHDEAARWRAAIPKTK
ncbi:MAG: serine/threonine protein kinase [Phycisphaerae bacterium]|nr:serine/threonine protein kinase [Phycisphaerae bacterium]